MAGYVLKYGQEIELAPVASPEVLGPVSSIHRLPLFISCLQKLVDSPRFIRIPRWNISVLERRPTHNVIEALSVIVVDVSFWIMQVDPAPNLHG